MRRRRVLGSIGLAVGGGVAGCSGSGEGSERAFIVASPPLESAATLPGEFRCGGAGQSPPFTVERVPEPTAALAVIADYDRGPFNEPVFWTLWNVPPGTDRIPAGLPQAATVASLGDARQGRKPDEESGYDPPCPPTGQAYTVRYQVYALGEELGLDGGAAHEPATEAIESAVLASRRFSIEYTRTPTG